MKTSDQNAVAVGKPASQGLVHQRRETDAVRVTVSLPAAIHRKLRLLSVDLGTSLTGAINYKLAETLRE